MIFSPPRRAALLAAVALLLMLLASAAWVGGPGSVARGQGTADDSHPTTDAIPPPPFTGCQFKGSRPVRRGRGPASAAMPRASA